MNLFELVVKIAVDDKASKAISDLSNKLGTGLKNAAKVGIAAIGAATTAIAAFGAESVKAGMSFDAAMSEVSAISGATGDDFDALRAKALEMGASTKFSASESAEALTYMAMAGWKTEDMLDGIEGIMHLAAASGEDLALTSDIVTDALTGFGLSAADSGRFADVLAAASSNANTNVAMLGESFKYIAPVAGALGYTAEDTAVALGLMANSGIKGSQAGTSLRGALSSMIKPSDNVYGAMVRLGLATEDAVVAMVNEDGTSKSLAETMGILREAFSTLTEAEQAEYAANIFGREAMSGMLAIINASDEDFNKLTAAINDSSGAAKEMSNVMIDNLAGDVTIFKSALEGAQIVVSDQLTPTLREFVQFGSSAISVLSTAFQNGGLTETMDALERILSKGLQMVIDKLPDMVDAGTQFLGALSTGILNNLPKLVDTSMQIVTKIVQSIVEFVNSGALLDAALATLDALISGMKDNLSVLVQAAVDIITGLATMLTDPEVLSGLFEAAMALIAELGSGLINSIPNLVDAVFKIIENIIIFLLNPENLANLVLAAGELVFSLAAGIAKSAFKVFESILELVAGIIKAIFTTDWLQVGADLVKGLWDGLVSMWNGLVDWFSNAWNGLVDGILGFLGISSPSKLFRGIGNDTIEGLVVGMEGMESQVQSTADGIVEGLTNTVANGIDSASEWGADMMQNFADGLSANEPDLSFGTPILDGNGNFTSSRTGGYVGTYKNQNGRTNGVTVNQTNVYNAAVETPRQMQNDAIRRLNLALV